MPPKSPNIKVALRTLSAVGSNPALLAAVEEAARSPKEWRSAVANPTAFLRRNRIRLPRGVSISMERPPRGLARRLARVIIACVRLCVRTGGYIVCVTVCIIIRR